MPPVAPSTPVLRVRPVLASMWAVFRAHTVVLTGLAVVLHFLAWKFVGQLQVDFLAYVGQTFRVDLPELTGRLLAAGSEVVSDFMRDILAGAVGQMDQVGGLSVVLAYGLAMQAAVAELMFGASDLPAPAPNRVPRSAPTLVAARFQRVEFVFDMARSLGIMLVVFAAIALNMTALGLAVFVFELEVFHFLHSVPWIRVLFLLAAALAFMSAVVIIAVRWFVAIPATIVENVSVRESLRRSWRLTGPCWKKLTGLYLLLQVPFELVIPVLDALAGLGADSPARGFAEWGVLTIGRTMAAAILASVCYDHLRRAEPPPEPASTPPSGPGRQESAP